LPPFERGWQAKPDGGFYYYSHLKRILPHLSVVPLLLKGGLKEAFIVSSVGARTPSNSRRFDIPYRKIV